MATQPQTVPTAKSRWALESRAAALERFLERHQAWILTIWSLVYFGGTMLRAHGKPFWYDEILTLLEARQPNLEAALRAGGDVDWMPPASHITFYLANKLAGSGEVGFRLPVIIGFWVFCLCLYAFARRRVNVSFALMAMLLPFASAFQMYSFEARSYAIVLGFCGIALVCWQAAVESEMRTWSLAGLAAGIAGALLFHYWAVLIYLPLAGAEAYRSIRRRGIDWPIWVAFFAGCIPLAVSLPFVLRSMPSWLIWRVAHPRDYIEFYQVVFRVWFAFGIPAILLLAAWFALGGWRERPAGSPPASIPDHEWIAAVLLLLTPVAAISIALAVPPHMFTARYAVPVIAGYALLGSFLAARFAGGRAAIGIALALAAAAPFTYLVTFLDRFQDPFLQAPGLDRALQNGTVVVEDLVPYLQLWYYAPDELKPRLLFLTLRGPKPAQDQKANGRRVNLVTEFSKLGVPLGAYQDFAFPGREFFIFSGRKGNLQQQVLNDGGTLEMVARSGNDRLLRARLK
jgi:hypothetical protein